WVSYMGRILGDSPKEEFPMPERVVLAPVDEDPSNECVHVVMMAFVKGTEPAACGARRQTVPPGAPGGIPGAPTPGPQAIPGAVPPTPGQPSGLPRETYLDGGPEMAPKPPNARRASAHPRPPPLPPGAPGPHMAAPPDAPRLPPPRAPPSRPHPGPERRRPPHPP